MFSRQRTLLRLLHNEGGSASRLRLMKLAFMVSRQVDAPPTGVYEFVPYRRGPFSFTLYYDLATLRKKGWVDEFEHDLRLTQGTALEIASLDHQFLGRIDGVSDLYRGKSTTELVDYVYSEYPWFTINSESTHKRAVARPYGEIAVYTVGYEGLMVDGMLNILLHSGVRRLIDIRRNPIGRRYGFHKSTLDRLCADLGIEYMHIPSLGIPSAWRAGLEDPASYERLLVRYEREILPLQTASVRRVVRLIQQVPSALMCMEADHKSCHRSRLAVMVSEETGLDIRELR